MRTRWLTVAAMLFGLAGNLPADELKKTLQDDLLADGWIYEDIEAGYAAARKSGKPLLVTFRCVP